MKTKERKIHGISDTYIAREAVDAATGCKFLEIYKPDDKAYPEEFAGPVWLCDIDGTLDDSDDYILDEIDSALDE